MKCPLCKTEFDERLFDSVRDVEYSVEGKFRFSRCSSCSLVALDPLPSLELLKKAYPLDYHGFHTSRKGLIGSLYNVVNRLRMKEYSRFLPVGGRLLDIGCADAPYFDILKNVRPDVEAVGVEMIEEIAQKGRDKGRKIITGLLSDLNKNEHGSFDLIIMNNLIEHVLDPLDELDRAGKLLKSGGHIILETPNTDSWDFKLAGKYWGGLHTPRHTFLFLTQNLSRLAENAGFKLIKKNFLLNTDHWALSVQNFLQCTKYFKCKINFGRVWYYKYLLLAFIPLNLIQRVIGKTGSFCVVLKLNKSLLP